MNDDDISEGSVKKMLQLCEQHFSRPGNAFSVAIEAIWARASEIYPDNYSNRISLALYAISYMAARGDAVWSSVVNMISENLDGDDADNFWRFVTKMRIEFGQAFAGAAQSEAVVEMALAKMKQEIH